MKTVVVTSPSLKVLENRLYSRATDNKEIIEKRLQNAKNEIKYIDKYDYFIINDNLEKAAKELLGIAIAAKIKSSLYNHKEFITNWLQ
jgi:guanylate kinase